MIIKIDALDSNVTEREKSALSTIRNWVIMMLRNLYAPNNTIAITLKRIRKYANEASLVVRTHSLERKKKECRNLICNVTPPPSYFLLFLV